MKKNRWPPLGSFINVEWIDSTAWLGWAPYDVTRECRVKLDPCESAGWLIAVGEESVTIANSLSRQTDCCNGVLSIPKFAIKKMTILPRMKRAVGEI